MTLYPDDLDDPRGHRLGYKETLLPHKQEMRALFPEYNIPGEEPRHATHTTWQGWGTFAPSDETHPDGNRSTRRAAIRQRVLHMRAHGKLTQQRNPAPMGG